PQLDALLQRIRAFPPAFHGMLFTGVRRLTDYQDPRYADEYLDRVSKLHDMDRASGGADKGHALALAAPKSVAVAMTYDDVIGVAELKTRSRRFERVRMEVGAKTGQIVYTTEFMHPRLEEFAGTLPARLGRWVEAHPKLVGPLFGKGRRVRTGT